MDSYEEKQKRLLALFEEMDSGEEEEINFSPDNSVDDPEYLNSESDNDGNSSNSDSECELAEDEGITDEDVTLEEQNNQQEENIIEELWTSTIADIPNFNFDQSTAGCLICENSPRDVFDSFFAGELLSLIINATNVYGERLCNQGHKTRYSRSEKFKPTNSTEILKFIGLCLLQGQLKPLTIRHLFSTHPLYHHPVFPQTMSGRRFEQILRCFNVNPELNETHLNKITSFVKLFNEKCQEANSPGQNLSLDESLLLFRGRLHFKVYIKNKKSKYGIKFYELCDPNGYVFNLEIYSGKQIIDPANSKLNSLVLRLMNPYLGKGHTLFMDNFYNSVTLANIMLTHKTHTCGTLRSNRKENPKDLIGKKLRKGELIWARKGGVYVSKWKDKREVISINTAFHPAMVTTTNSYGKERKKPIEIKMYNQNMSGVDRIDQLVSYYSCPRKTVRWYKKVLFHLIDLSVFNSYFIYKKKIPKITYLQFRDSLICSFLNVQNTSRKLNHRNPENRVYNSTMPQQTTSTSSQHSLEKSPFPKNRKRKTYFRDCKCCKQIKKRKQTAYRCKQCPDKPPLCLECFETWHKTNTLVQNQTN